MKITTSFKKICELNHKIKAIQGSQGAGKTYSILQRWILLAARSKKFQVCHIVSDTIPNLRDGAVKDFEAICQEEQIIVKKTKSPYVYLIGRWKFQFFSVDKEGKGLGGRRDRLFINEATRIKWKIARQLISRTHVEVIFDFNPVGHFWVHQQYVDVGDCDFIKLTYKDNEFLPRAEVESIEKHAPWGKVPDENYWRVFGLGEIGFVEGQILKGYQKYKEIPEGVETQDAIGVDWGFQDPMAAVKVMVDHKNSNIYWKQLFYASGARVDDLIKCLQESEDYNYEYLACDHHPQSVMHMREKGFSALNADKSAGIVNDIRTIKQYNLFIHEDSHELIKEADSWKYQEKFGRIIEYPDQSCEEHGLDAGRYGTTLIVRS